MGLPEINIEFKTLAVSAIQRSARGIVALILKDDTTTTDTFIYNTIDEVQTADWTADNKDYIDKTFMGSPAKVIVERIDTTALDYNGALERLKNKKWNWLAIPGIADADTTNIASFITSQRNNYHKTFKAVLPNEPADNEGIVNFTTNNIVVDGVTYTANDYTCRIAGILAGLPFTRSSTYFKLTEVENIEDKTDPNTNIDNGELILINDGENIKIGRGVNSLVTATVSKGAKFKKIKIIEAVDLMRDDIRNTFENNYVGQVNNSYDNKVLFISAVNAYFKGLQKDEVLDPNFDAKAEIDFDTQMTYLQSSGIDTSTLKEAEIKEYNTGSKVFIKASGSPLDAMEDLDFSMLIQ